MVLPGLVTSESVPVINFCKIGDEAWNFIGMECFFMQVFEAAKKTVSWICCSDYTLPYSTEVQYVIS
jgi:hypothetical protein